MADFLLDSLLFSWAVHWLQCFPSIDSPLYWQRWSPMDRHVSKSPRVWILVSGPIAAGDDGDVVHGCYWHFRRPCCASVWLQSHSFVADIVDSSAWPQRITEQNASHHLSFFFHGKICWKKKVKRNCVSMKEEKNTHGHIHTHTLASHCIAYKRQTGR